MASARSKPVTSTTAPAVAAASDAKRSVSTCARAPSTFSERRSALPSATAAPMFAHAPSRPTTSTKPPSTSGADHRRRIASTAMTPASTSSVAPLAWAERISARPRPKVKRPAAGRAASPAAYSATRDRARVGEHVRRVGEQRQRVGQDAGDDLDDHEGRDDAQRDREPAAVGVGRRAVVVMGVAVRVLVRHALSVLAGRRAAARRGSRRSTRTATARCRPAAGEHGRHDRQHGAGREARRPSSRRSSSRRAARARRRPARRRPARRGPPASRRAHRPRSRRRRAA